MLAGLFISGVALLLIGALTVIGAFTAAGIWLWQALGEEWEQRRRGAVQKNVATRRNGA